MEGASGTKKAAEHTVDPLKQTGCTQISAWPVEKAHEDTEESGGFKPITIREWITSST